MTTSINFEITNIGNALIGKILADKKVVFTKMSIGDGFYDANLKDATELSNELFEILISTKRVDELNNTVLLRGAFDDNQHNNSFYYREVGIWAVDPDLTAPNNQVLFAYGNYGENADFVQKSTHDAPIIIQKQVEAILYVGNCANVEIHLDTNTENFQTRDEKGEINGYTPLGADKLVPSEFLPNPLPKNSINASSTKEIITFTPPPIIEVPWKNPAMTAVSQDGYTVSGDGGYTSGSVPWGAFGVYGSGVFCRVNKNSGARTTILTLPDGKKPFLTSFKLPSGSRGGTQATPYAVTLYLDDVSVFSKSFNFVAGQVINVPNIQFNKIYIRLADSLQADWIESGAFEFNGYELIENPNQDGEYDGKTIYTSSFTGTDSEGNTFNLSSGSLEVAQKKYKNIATSANAIGTAGLAAFPLSFAFDNSLSTSWASSFTGNSIVTNQVNIGQKNIAKKIDFIRVYDASSAQVNFKIQISKDGTTWADITSEIKNNMGGSVLIELPHYDYSEPYQLRLLATSFVGNQIYGWYILELQFLVEDPTGTIALNDTFTIISNENRQLEQKGRMFEQMFEPTNAENGDLWFDNNPIDPKGREMVNNTWVDKIYCKIGQAIITDDVITSVSTYPFNSNGYNFNNSVAITNLCMPDYTKETALTNGVLFAAHANGYIQNGITKYLSPISLISKGESFTPNSANFRFYPMKGD